MELLIRPAEPGDLAALHALVERAYRGDTARAGWTHEADMLDGERTDAASVAVILTRPDERLLAAFHDGQLVGCVQVTGKPGGRAYLGMLAVEPVTQAGGLGKQIIAAAEACGAEVFGAGVMELCVISRRAELIAYYQRRGYRLTGETRPFPIEVDPPLILAVLEKTLA